MEEKRTCIICGKSFEPKDKRIRKPHQGQCCGKSCGVAYGRRRMKGYFIQEFLARILIGDDCWEWQGGRFIKGYGQCGSKNPRDRVAHRRAWKILVGPIPDGLEVLHKCDNPPCVRPSHLFLGTQKDNMQDCIKKNRFTQSGETHWKARLNWMLVEELRTNNQGKSIAEITRLYHLPKSTVRNVIKYKTWNKPDTLNT